MAVSTNSSRRPDEDDSARNVDAETSPAAETTREADSVTPPESSSTAGAPGTPQGTPFEGISARPRPVSVSEDQQTATLAHMLGIAGCLPAIVIHRWSRGRARFTEQESLEAANFTLAPSLVILVCALLAFVPYVGWIFALVGAATWLFLAVCSLQGAIVVNKGRPFVYRFNTYLYDLLTRRRAERKAARMSSGPMTATGEIVSVRPKDQ
ncbi:DUF4870 domain-containing protein [Kocuria sp.]|uniref:DUF4870 domain-containing protein n=1 Tax=Kocuria sp. TaxID=1871328 RepID=UPI0026E0E3FA|nr:DUF4870 domain-containing protein [Kocuria sp.]MDO5617694.1 DUF4870 domain-containing protein [Kocuria sp.]